MREIIPKYLKNLEALGIDIKKLLDKKKLRFLKRKELIQKFGEEEFKVLETIGKTIREGRWKGSIKTRYLLEDLKDIFGDNLPEEVREILKEETIDSLTLHYLKRKYKDGWNLASPKELDRLFIDVLRKGRYVFEQIGGR